MIQNDEQLDQALHARQKLERALKALRARVHDRNPVLYAAMAQDYLDQIRQIQEAIDDYIGVPEAKAASAPIWLGLEGKRIHIGDLSSKLVADWLNRMRIAIQTVAEYYEEGAVRLLGRPKAPIAAMADFRIVGLREGSVLIGLRLPQPEQGELFPRLQEEDRNAAELAVDRILRLAAWASSTDGYQAAYEIAPDAEERQLLATQMLRLIPPARGPVSKTTFHGPAVPKETGIRLVADVRARVSALAHGEVQEEYREYEGVLREIDLDAQRVIVRNRPDRGPNVTCRVPDELMDAAERALNHRVRVGGITMPARPNRLEIQWLENLDEEGNGQRIAVNRQA
jgi:hypothetical protein